MIMKRIFLGLSLITTSCVIYLENHFGTIYMMYWISFAILVVGIVTGVWVVINKMTYRYLLSGAPFVRTGKSELATILGYLSRLNQKVIIVDLGAGDGNIIIELAKFGYNTVGLEINPLLVAIAKLKINLLKLSKFANVRLRNFWAQDLSGFDVVIVFGIPYIMQDLVHKIKTECKPGTIVISNKFHIPGLLLEENLGNVLIYKTS